jgi:hypothetical protein
MNRISEGDGYRYRFLSLLRPNRLRDLLPLVPAVKAALKGLAGGSTVTLRAQIFQLSLFEG